jgi:hypothetical protein
MCQPAPDVAALDQYCDSLPSADGQEKPLAAAGPRQMPLSRALPARTVARLRNSGPEAKALLLLPVVAPVRRDRQERERIRASARKVLRTTRLEAPKVSPEAVVSGTAEAVVAGLTGTGGNGPGGAFRWGLLVSTLGFAGMAWLRFRTRLKL